ncbi:MAG: NAD-dependent epimerase/dehydratase family protein, partial [Myxococcota bacterium]|nr:NAD-dependent epimerase/dehydratase family protein [Myxococcota bacterium]
MRVLVTGATGFLGEHLIAALDGRGHSVRALVRSTSRTADLERRGIEIVRAGFDDASGLRRAMDGIEAIVHAAGGGLTPHVEEVYRANAGSTRALLEALPSSVRRFVLVSSVAAHGPSPAHRDALETDPDAPRSHYGRSKLEAERAALAHADRLEVVVVRPPTLYGPGEHRMIPLFRAARRGVLPMVHPSGRV